MSSHGSNIAGNLTASPSTQRTSTEASIIASAVFNTVVMLLTIVGNVLVCFSVYYFPRLRRPTNFFIVSLAVSDLLVGLLSLPFRLIQTINHDKWPESFGHAGCQFWIWIDMFCCGASILNLTGISFDRLLAVKWPLTYRERVTTKRASLMILFVWFYALVVASLSLVKWGGQDTIVIKWQCSIQAQLYITIVSLAAFFCPLAIVIVNYALVLKVAIVHARQVQRDKDALAVNFLPDQDTNDDTSGIASSLGSSSRAVSIAKRRSSEGLSKHNHQKRRRSSGLYIVKQLKATKTLAIVVGVFILSWFPFFVIFLTFQYCPDCFEPHNITLNAKRAIVVVFVYVLPVSNSAANPIIYTCFNKEFRTAFLRILSKISRKSDASLNSKANGYSECSTYA